MCVRTFLLCSFEIAAFFAVSVYEYVSIIHIRAHSAMVTYIYDGPKLSEWHNENETKERKKEINRDKGGDTVS